jgi:hypothetical protein
LATTATRPARSRWEITTNAFDDIAYDRGRFTALNAVIR